MSDSGRKVAEFFQRVRVKAVPRFDRATVAFYGVHNERVVKERTGVMLRIANSVFILTASHYLRENVKNSIPLYVSWNERTDLPIPLHDARFYTTEYDSPLGERDVVRDVAAVKLSDSTAREILAAGRTPMSLCDISMSQDRSPGIFFMFGFPQAWFRMEHSGPICLPLVYGCGIYPGEHWAGSEIGYDPKVHLLLDFRREAITPIDGQSHTLPGYEGIVGVSGCGIWRVIDLHGSIDIDRWEPDQCKLVAIQHRYYEQPGYLHTTWIQYAISRIFDDYPELKSAATMVPIADANLL